MPTENRITEQPDEVKRYRFKGAAGAYVYAGDFDNATRCYLDATERCLAAERREQALQLRLNAADHRIDELEQDKARLDAIEANFWDVRHQSSSLANTGDYTSSIEIIGHWMDKPTERVIGENYNENLRAAIDQAMAAPAYPPARPEYPDDESADIYDWHMNPCSQGHREVGAAGGVADCYTCDEKITATTTQEAFELWNASHPKAEQSV